MEFQKEKALLSLLKSELDKRSVSGAFAVLDADGTLWPEDANYSLLKYEDEKKLRDVKELIALHHATANRPTLCRSFAEKQVGFEWEEFKMHCREALKAMPLNVFSFQRDLIAYLKKKDMKVIVLTASIKWLVEEALQLYDLPVDYVLGMETRIKEGKISTELIQPAPFSNFKGEAFLKYSQGEKCLLAGGNTSTDLPVLEMAELPFVVHSAGPEDEMFLEEKEIVKLARRRNWIVFEK